MPVKEDREKMMHALKEIVFPYLRKIGFRGSFPHFRRMRETATDIITFQFNQYGGSFVVELVDGPVGGLQRQDTFIPARELTTWHFVHSIRLGSPRKINSDNWFEFGRNMFGEYISPPTLVTHLPGKYIEISELIVRLLEEYFAKNRVKNI